MDWVAEPLVISYTEYFSETNIVIIIIIIYCNWVVTQWQWLFYMYTKCEISYY